ACGKSDEVLVIAYGRNAALRWQGVESKLEYPFFCGRGGLTTSPSGLCAKSQVNGLVAYHAIASDLDAQGPGAAPWFAMAPTRCCPHRPYPGITARAVLQQKVARRAATSGGGRRLGRGRRRAVLRRSTRSRSAGRARARSVFDHLGKCCMMAAACSSSSATRA